MTEDPLSRSRASSSIRIYCCAYSRIVVAKHQGFRLSGELNSLFLGNPGSAVQERVLPSRIKWRRTNTTRSTALSRFHPATATPARCPWIMVTRWTWPICYLPRVRIRTIRNYGAVELELHRPDEQWDLPRDCGEKQSPNARPYNRNRVSLNRAREEEGVQLD